ncbi:hypothetical protein BH20ACT2_BH20ACT2_05910 [soil metagenome]
MPGGPRVSGEPRSANGASSFHLWWRGIPAGAPVVAAEVTLELVTPPAVPRLYFWALQASFTDRGTPRGAGHLGLQWHPAHPGSTAVNWGGYHEGGGELDGTISTLPSALGNPNTRDLAWRTGAAHRLVIASVGDGAWRGSIDGVAVRDLQAGGAHLAALVVWSEVFARCDDPSVTVRWSDLTAITAAGERLRPEAVQVSYQARRDGGCDNTNAAVDGLGVVQTTNTARQVAPGAVLDLR